MLTIKCSACRAKLFRYDKLGPGEVLRCHKDRIERDFGIATETDGRLRCSCGKTIGIDRGGFYKMDPKAFTYSGTKRNS